MLRTFDVWGCSWGCGLFTKFCNLPIEWVCNNPRFGGLTQKQYLKTVMIARLLCACTTHG